MSTLEDIAAEYFQRVEPCIGSQYPYTLWAVTLTQRCAKQVFDELVARHAITEETLHQAIRAYQQGRGRISA